jgi:hypothetical protein
MLCDEGNKELQNKKVNHPLPSPNMLQTMFTISLHSQRNYTAFVFIPYVNITNIIINIMKPTIENEVLQVCIWNCAAHFLKVLEKLIKQMQAVRTVFNNLSISVPCTMKI